MNYKKIIPYKLRRALSMAAIAGAPMLPASCCKVQQDPTPQKPTHNVEIEFAARNMSKTITKKMLQELINDETVKNIYLCATDHWNGWTAGNIVDLRTQALQPYIEMSEKIHGRGDFDFKLGEASKVHDDSLWFVKNGWTINKQHQK